MSERKWHTHLDRWWQVAGPSRKKIRKIRFTFDSAGPTARLTSAVNCIAHRYVSREVLASPQE